MIGLTIIAVVALVIAAVALIGVVTTHRNVKNDVKNEVTRELSLAFAQYQQNLNTEIQNRIPPFVQGAVAGQISKLDIPNVVATEVKKHQSGALLIEGGSQ